MMRLPSGGTALDRTRVLRFTFDGRGYQGFAGDTLASALLANGVALLGRGFKYHRPRGVLGAGSEEPNALVTLGGDTPNTRATLVPLREGLAARSQNAWPSLRWDAGALAGLAAPLLPAGFYYKLFHTGWHRVWEPLIRRMAGLGTAPGQPDEARYANRYAHVETLVVGAGPAGQAAAMAAARDGGRVLLCDEGATGFAHPGVTVLPRTTAFHFGLGNFVCLAQLGERPRERVWQVRARRVVLAAGAVERPIPFRGNDRPGVMLAGAALRYLREHAVLVGRSIAAVVAHDSGYEALHALREAGATISVVVEMRDAAPAAAEGLPVLAGHRVVATRGRRRVRGLVAAPRDGGQARAFPCDALLMAGGWTPSVHLFSQARGRLRWDPALDAFLPDAIADDVRCVGACAGEGLAPGMPLTELVRGADAHAFLDLQNDVTVGDIRLALREGFTSIEHVKRYTTTGMATDQGKTSAMLGLAVAAEALGRSIPEVGHTSFRPPFTPVSFGTLAGRHRGALFDPVRTAPTHAWVEQAGAVFEPVGLWQRARYYPRPGEDLHAAVARECAAVRGATGILDASTLGKIEVVGPDAAEFLERCYVNGFHRLAVGRCRYGLLLREDGFLYDDGVIARLAEDRFHVTTTTGGAARVLHMLEDYRQTEFPELRVWLTSTTEHWGVIAVQGPRARETLAPLVQGVDLGALPHLGVAACTVAGQAARLMRVSFTGERGYEVNVPAGATPALWDALLARGALPYGTEAMHWLRAEKGYIIVGQESDGTVVPDDLGLGWCIAKGKRDFIGKRSLARAELRRPDRRQLVGLTPLGATRPDEGAQLLTTAEARAAEGHVTSSYPCAVLGLLAGGRARHGETVYATSLAGAPVALRVGPACGYDPEGKRLDG